MEFEQKMKRLEELLTKIESAQTGLDEAMKLFEEAVNLKNELSEALGAYEGKLEELVVKNAQSEHVPFEVELQEEDDDEF